MRWMPTYKWWVGTVTAVTTVVYMLWAGGGIHTAADKAVVLGLISQRLITYITSNEKPVEPSV